MTEYQGNSAIISDNQSHKTTIDQAGSQPLNTYSTSYGDSTTFIAELDSTPIEPGKLSLNKNSGSSAVKKPAYFPQEAAKARLVKLKDPAVLVNLPKSPSAQAYECAHAQMSEEPGKSGYFDPVFVDTEEPASEEQP